jgi:hypothetical protein
MFIIAPTTEPEKPSSALVISLPMPAPRLPCVGNEVGTKFGVKFEYLIISRLIAFAFALDNKIYPLLSVWAKRGWV